MTDSASIDRFDAWLAREAFSFSLDNDEAFSTAVILLMAELGDAVRLLGFGEALHGGEEILLLRNKLFQKLVAHHGYSAIAIESSFPRGWAMNEYVAGGGTTYEAAADAGVTHGFGNLAANRELIEWMRQYNADTSHPTKLQFYGFDSPTEYSGADSPRRLLQVALNYLAAVGDQSAKDWQQRIDALLGDDAAWEQPGATLDASKSIGRSESAMKLRIETGNLIAHLQTRRPACVAVSGESAYRDAEHHVLHARSMLNYHATLADPSPNRVSECLALRDLMMAENLAYIVDRERPRGKVLAFAHNGHVKRGRMSWQMGPTKIEWWAAGAHLQSMLGQAFAVVGTAIGESSDNGIASPEPGTLEAKLTATAGPIRCVPLRRAPRVDLPMRAASTRNGSYFPLGPESLAEFDALVALDSVTYWRGGRPLP